jgi:hypothetical protein
MRIKYRLIMGFAALAAAATASAAAPVRIAFQGRVVTTPSPVVGFQGGTLVPLRPVAEALGGRVEWGAATKTAAVRHEGRTLEVDQRANTLKLNGRPLRRLIAPRTAMGQLLVPLRAVEWVFRVDGRWAPRQRLLRFAAAPRRPPGGGGMSEPVINTQAPTVVGGLRLSLTADRRVYSVREPVALTLTVANPGRSPVTLQFPSSQQYDFEVRRAGQVVWRWSAGRMFAQALTSLTLGAGEQRVFTQSWNQQDNNDQPVAPGAYEAAATLTTMGRPRPQTEPLPFRIGS